MPGFERKDLLKKLNEMKASGIPIVGGGAGTGLSAKCEEEGGIDLIVIYNSGRYRMAGRGSLSGLLAYGNANEIVKEMASEVIPVTKSTPVLAGVNGTDPFCNFDMFLDDLKRLGFSGIQNFPTVGLIDGNFRANLEETGMSFSQEVDVIRMAVEKIDSWSAAALAVNPDAIVLCHGGPIAMPEDASFILKRTKNCHGFYGASSMERLPTEIALVEQTKAFKSITFD